jgi:ubiquinone/menaquinone biosynthesis C-methylase UbiE
MKESDNFWRQVAQQAASYYPEWLKTGFLGTNTWFNEYLMQRTQSSVMRLVSKPGVTSVLDVGCGIGQWSTFLTEKLGFSVVGVDFIGEMLQLAKFRAKYQRCDVSFCRMSASNIGARETRFDLVLSITVLQHIFDPVVWKNAISEMLRVTKIGGWIIILEAAPTYWYDNRVQKYSYIRTEEEYVHEFQNHGATLVATYVSENVLDNLIGFAQRMLVHYAARVDKIDLQQFSQSYVKYRPLLVLPPCLLVLMTARVLDRLMGTLKKPHHDSMSKFFIFRKIDTAPNG